MREFDRSFPAIRTSARRWPSRAPDVVARLLDGSTYALASDGKAGFAHVLRLIEAELRLAMTLTGCTSIGRITRNF